MSCQTSKRNPHSLVPANPQLQQLWQRVETELLPGQVLRLAGLRRPPLLPIRSNSKTTGVIMARLMHELRPEVLPLTRTRKLCGDIW